MIAAFLNFETQRIMQGAALFRFSAIFLGPLVVLTRGFFCTTGTFLSYFYTGGILGEVCLAFTFRHGIKSNGFWILPGPFFIISATQISTPREILAPARLGDRFWADWVGMKFKKLVAAFCLIAGSFGFGPWPTCF